MVGIALLVFPKLALGLSGFETGVAVMPQIAGRRGRHRGAPARPDPRRPAAADHRRGHHERLPDHQQHRHHAVLIPEQEFQPGGEANGRALAYLAHEYLGNGFGTVYDISHHRDPLVRRRLRDGRAAEPGPPLPARATAWRPEWARAVRPLVLVFTLVAFLVTWLFDADVDAQGGAYATGVLVLMTSAAVAVTLSARRAGQRKRTIGFGVIAVVFIYTTIANIIERPDGIQIAAFFIAGDHRRSRCCRGSGARSSSTPPCRPGPAGTGVHVAPTWPGPLRLIAHEPLRLSPEAYRDKLTSAIEVNHLPEDDQAFSSK